MPEESKRIIRDLGSQRGRSRDASLRNGYKILKSDQYDRVTKNEDRYKLVEKEDLRSNRSRSTLVNYSKLNRLVDSVNEEEEEDETRPYAEIREKRLARERLRQKQNAWDMHKRRNDIKDEEVCLGEGSLRGNEEVSRGRRGTYGQVSVSKNDMSEVVGGLIEGNDLNNTEISLVQKLEGTRYGKVDQPFSGAGSPIHKSLLNGITTTGSVGKTNEQADLVGSEKVRRDNVENKWNGVNSKNKERLEIRLDDANSLFAWNAKDFMTAKTPNLGGVKDSQEGGAGKKLLLLGESSKANYKISGDKQVKESTDTDEILSKKSSKIKSVRITFENDPSEGLTSKVTTDGIIILTL